MDYDTYKLMTPEEANPERKPLRDKSRDEYNYEDKIKKLEREEDDNT